MNFRNGTRTLIAVGLGIVGSGRIVAWALQSEDLDNTMFRLGLSPLPIAFSHHSGHEDIVIFGELRLRQPNAEKQQVIRLTGNDFNGLSGSWTARGIVLISSLYAPRFDAKEVEAAVRGLGCSLWEPVEQIELNLLSRKNPFWRFERSYSCAKTSP